MLYLRSGVILDIKWCGSIGIGLAKKLLDWEPVVNLEEGLKNTITYFEGVVIDSAR